MPVKFLLHPKDGRRLEFAEAAPVLDRDCDIPPAVTALVIADLGGETQTHVRPSDVVPAMTCRRQKVWMSANEYGVNPLERWPMIEGTAIHKALATQEIEVPGNGERVEVCGVEMRGHIDNVDGDTIEDYKTKSPFYITKYGPKGSGVKPWVEPWEPDLAKQIDDHKHQLSLYGVLLRKGKDIHTTYGRIRRIYRGMKADKGIFKTIKFPLMTEAQLEVEVGPWMRELDNGLKMAEIKDPEAWRTIKADGREFIGSRGQLWACERCSLCKQCEEESGWSGF